MKASLSTLLSAILKEQGIDNVAVDVGVPDNLVNGDYTTNVAMKVASQFKKPPMEIALQVVQEVKCQMSNVKCEIPDQNTKQKDQKDTDKLSEMEILQAIDHIEVAPPGFINVFLTEVTLVSQLTEVLKKKEAYGATRVSSIKYQVSGKTIRKNLTHDTLTLDTLAKRVMVEFAHPNTHKAFHIGHLRNITTGESIVRLLESQGYKVIRANYQGDVGMHIAKCLHSILHNSKFKIQNSKLKNISDKIKLLGKAYAAGSKAFDEDKEAQEAIKDINYLIYAGAQRFSQEKGIAPSSTDYMKFVHGRETDVEKVYELWKETRQWSLDYFETIYKRVGSQYDRYYFEGECLAGVDLAHEAVKKGILKESDGAIVFDGKPFGLHTRVFVNSLGLPTYEAKELALAQKEFSEFGTLERIIHVVGPEQTSFFKVTFKVEELLWIQRDQQHHLVYGWVRLKEGKMSSRSGNVVLGEWLLDEAKKEINIILQKSASKYTKAQQEEIAEKAAVAAVKYSFLRVSTQSEISFDLKESISFEGDSGPYLQYTYARAKSVLRKAEEAGIRYQVSSVKQDGHTMIHDTLTRDTYLNPEERAVLRHILYFPDVVADAAQNFAPSTLCTHLFKLAQAFNLFYAKHTILGDTEKVSSVKYQVSSQKKNMILDTLTLDTARLRLAVTAATAQVLKNGLTLLGIPTLEQM